MQCNLFEVRLHRALWCMTWRFGLQFERLIMHARILPALNCSHDDVMALPQLAEVLVLPCRGNSVHDSPTQPAVRRVIDPNGIPRPDWHVINPAYSPLTIKTYQPTAFLLCRIDGPLLPRALQNMLWLGFSGEINRIGLGGTSKRRTRCSTLFKVVENIINS